LFKHAQLESVKAWIGDPAHGALPLHARIQRAIRQLILDGALDVGKPLPASRALAKSLGVSRDTVESAYSQLHAEGFIERRVGSGSFVSSGHSACQDVAWRQDSGSQSAPLRLSQRGAAMFQGGGVRDFLRPARLPLACRTRAAFRCKPGSVWSGRC
jgi:GntR family transcriptional regulator/MocR family aminotransferase